MAYLTFFKHGKCQKHGSSSHYMPSPQRLYPFQCIGTSHCACTCSPVFDLSVILVLTAQPSIKGVSPCNPLESTLAPNRMTVSTASTKLRWAAMCRGLRPLLLAFPSSTSWKSLRPVRWHRSKYCSMWWLSKWVLCSMVHIAWLASSAARLPLDPSILSCIKESRDFPSTCTLW